MPVLAAAAVASTHVGEIPVFCPSSWLLFGRNGIPVENGFHLGGWMPFILRDPAVWMYFCFYVMFKVGLSKHACRFLLHLRGTIFHLNTSRPLLPLRGIVPPVMVPPVMVPPVMVPPVMVPPVIVPPLIHVQPQHVTIPPSSALPPSVLSPPPISRLTSFMDASAQVVTAYLPSLFHALTTVVMATTVLLDAHDIVMWPYLTYYDVMMHSHGYLLADCVVDQNPVYFPHHIAPLLFSEAVLRVRGSFYHMIWFAWICELGNIYMHSSAIYYNSPTGDAYCTKLKYTLYLSRLLSILPALHVPWCDMPCEYLTASIIGASACLVAIYGSNKMSLHVASSSSSSSIVSKNPPLL